MSGTTPIDQQRADRLNASATTIEEKVASIAEQLGELDAAAATVRTVAQEITTPPPGVMSITLTYPDPFYVGANSITIDTTNVAEVGIRLLDASGNPLTQGAVESLAVPDAGVTIQYNMPVAGAKIHVYRRSGGVADYSVSAYSVLSVVKPRQVFLTYPNPFYTGANTVKITTTNVDRVGVLVQRPDGTYVAAQTKDNLLVPAGGLDLVVDVPVVGAKIMVFPSTGPDARELNLAAITVAAAARPVLNRSVTITYPNPFYVGVQEITVNTVNVPAVFIEVQNSANVPYPDAVVGQAVPAAGLKQQVNVRAPGDTIFVAAGTVDANGAITRDNTVFARTVAAAARPGATAGGDSITGTAGDDVINGLGGNDTINGGGGNDTIRGGPGVDIMTGGAGANVFVFEPGDGGDPPVHDRITDFKLGTDKLEVPQSWPLEFEADAAGIWVHYGPHENWHDWVQLMGVQTQDANLLQLKSGTPPPPVPGGPLNVLVRGQSNALLFVDRGGVWTFRDRLAALTGREVHMHFAWGQNQANTIHSGTGWIHEWMNGLAAGNLENDFLMFLNGMSPAAKAAPFVEIWMHNEYDQGADITAANYAALHRAERPMCLQALGLTAANHLRVFVPVRYGFGSNFESIKNGMESLAADASFNARMSWAAYGARMDGGPVPEAHFGDQDTHDVGWALANELAPLFKQVVTPPPPPPPNPNGAPRSPPPGTPGVWFEDFARPNGQHWGKNIDGNDIFFWGSGGNLEGDSTFTIRWHGGSGGWMTDFCIEGQRQIGMPNGYWECRAILYGWGVGSGSGPCILAWPGDSHWNSVDYAPDWQSREVDFGEIWGNEQTIYMAPHWTDRNRSANNGFSIFFVPKPFDNFQYHVYGGVLLNDRIIFTVDGDVIGVEENHGAPDLAGGGVNRTHGFMNGSPETHIRVDWLKWTPAHLVTYV
jgi:hypothetical protein